MVNNADFYLPGDFGIPSFPHSNAMSIQSTTPQLVPHQSGCGTPPLETINTQLSTLVPHQSGCGTPPLESANMPLSTQQKSNETSTPPAPTSVVTTPLGNTYPDPATNTEGIVTNAQAHILQGDKENDPPADGKERGLRCRKPKVVIPEWLQSTYDYLREGNEGEAWAECIAL